MKTHIGVMFGGRSVEHEISVLSALQAINAIDTDRFSIVAVYLSKDGAWYTGDALLNIDNYKDLTALKKRCQRVIASQDAGRLLLLAAQMPRFSSPVIAHIDVALPITHGTYGEDGCLQGLLELYDIPYIGCDVSASALGMDKIRFKEVGAARQLPMVKYCWFFTPTWYAKAQTVREQIAAQIGYPLIVKPADLGSSIGVSVVNSEDSLDEAMNLAASFTQRIIVETLVANVLEINCSVLGDGEQTLASVCEEPLHNAEFLSYEQKYQSDGAGTKGMESAKRKIPADIDPELTAYIQRLAQQTFNAIGANGVARIDFLINRATGEVFVNEINTIPGSLSFYLWQASGIDFSDLITRLVKLALKRAREKQALLRTNPVNILSLSAKGCAKL